MSQFQSDKIPLEDLFKENKYSIEVVRSVLFKMPLKKLEAVSTTNKYMCNKVCDDTFWLQYGEKVFDDKTELFKWSLSQKKSKLAMIVYKKYKSKIIDIGNLYMAVKFNQIDLVKEMLKNEQFDIKDNNSIIDLARYNDHVEILQLLLEDGRANPKNCDIVSAALNNEIKLIKVLLKDSRIDPSEYDNRAIIKTAKFGHLEVVKLLLADPRVDPTDCDHYAIQMAFEYNHLDVVQVLLNDHRVKKSLNIKKISFN